MKAVLQYRASPGFRRDLIAAAPDWLDVVIVDEADPDQFRSEMTDADVLLHVLEPVTRSVIEAAPELKLVQKIGVGVNTIDLEAAQDHGVAVANMPGSNSQAVAESALLLMLATLRRVVLIDRETRLGNGWNLDMDMVDQLGEIAGKTVGLLGYGAVPRLLAPMLTAIGADVLYVSRTEKSDAVGTRRELDQLLGESDIVSVHLPLNDSTSEMFDSQTFAKMKPGSILINTARGGLIKESDLVEALRSGQLRAAGLDVFAEEPVDPDHDLLALENTVVMPHVAWLTPETLRRSADICVENARRTKDGETLLHRVV